MSGITSQPIWPIEQQSLEKDARMKALDEKVISLTKSLKETKLTKANLAKIATQYASGTITEGYHKKTTLNIAISVIFISTLSEQTAGGRIPPGLYLLLKKLNPIKGLDRGSYNHLSFAFHWETQQVYTLRCCLSEKLGKHEKELHNKLVSLPEYFATGIAIDYLSSKKATPSTQIPKTAFILEYFPNGSLQKNIRAFHSASPTYKIQKRRYQKHDFITHLAQGILYLHQLGYVHLDLKPGNILISHSGKPVIIDFGFSSPPGGINHSGSIGYLSPQTIMNQNEGSAFEKSFSDDVWSFASILTYLTINPFSLTNHNEWMEFCFRTKGKTPDRDRVKAVIDFNYRYQTVITDLIRRGLAYDREDRITMQGVMEVLEQTNQTETTAPQKKKKKWFF